jgi:hypothetical protein
MKHRGVEFFINDKCSGLTGDCHKYLKGHYFSRFFTLEEMEMGSTDKPMEQRITIMKTGIDRLLSGNAVYKGDLRDRR